MANDLENAESRPLGAGSLKDAQAAKDWSAGRELVRRSEVIRELGDLFLRIGPSMLIAALHVTH